MRRYFSFFCFFLLIHEVISAQSFTDSNLPILIIKTDNSVDIPDSPRVLATMKIISRSDGERNSLLDQSNPAYLNYNGRISIEIRGSSSQYPQKKQYGFSTLTADNVTESNVSLLGMPAENDWVLNSMAFDTALIRDYLSYNLSRQIGEYASRTAYCEVVINGYYRGLYLLQEKIKADKNRVNVHKIETTANTVPEVTGGYITKADKISGNDIVVWNQQADFINVLPKPYEATPAQTNYIHNQFLALATTSYEGNSSLYDGFPSIIDMPSFIDYMIIQELSSNCDAYQYSTFFHKDRNGKLRAGPLWDNDLTYGNDLFLWGLDRSWTNVWQFSNGDNEGSAFWKSLFNNRLFRCYFSKRWNELIQPGQPLNLSVMESFIDQTTATISEAVERNYTRWGILTDFQKRIAVIKNFLALRIDWMTANLGSFGECSNIPVPPLVISKIMYNPPVSLFFPKSEEQEFVEITNNGDQNVSLTGIYFGGTGFVYQFPENAIIYPHSSIFLANNVTVFHEIHGFAPFGQFTRNLSDEAQNFILLDGFGNIIDNVSYTDTVPWPDARGNGKYLKLTDLNSDNSIPSNWVASGDEIFDNLNIPEDLVMVLFPNPVSDILHIQNGSEILSMTLFDASGRVFLTAEVNSKTCELDMSHMARGLYFIRAVTANGSITKKVIKE
jgi:hypothetical protein